MISCSYHDDHLALLQVLNNTGIKSQLLTMSEILQKMRECNALDKQATHIYNTPAALLAAKYKSTKSAIQNIMNKKLKNKLGDAGLNGSIPGIKCSNKLGFLKFS